MNIALTGGTGFVGQALVELAGRRGVELRALARRPQDGCEGVEWVQGDLAEPAALKALVAGSEAVIHVAGAINASDAAGFEAANVAGTLALLEAALAAGVPRFVFVSSLAAREPRLSAYGASKARAEKIVTASGLDWTIVRPPAVYGPRDREMFELFRAAKWGVVPLPPPGRLSVIHVEDLARLLLELVPGGEDVSGRIFEPEDASEDGWIHGDLARAIGNAMGRRVLAPQFSKPMLMRIATLDRLLRRGKAKLTPDRVNYMTHPDWVCSKTKVPPPQRWIPQVDTAEGLRRTAEWYRKEGWL